MVRQSEERMRGRGVQTPERASSLEMRVESKNPPIRKRLAKHLLSCDSVFRANNITPLSLRVFLVDTKTIPGGLWNAPLSVLMLLSGHIREPHSFQTRSYLSIIVILKFEKVLETSYPLSPLPGERG